MSGAVIPFKVGDKIRVVRHHNTRFDLYDEEGEVVRIEGDDYVYVVLPHHKLTPSYQADFQWAFNNAAARLQLISDATQHTTSRQEAPCKTCRRLNDVGASSCWLCGNAPF